MNMRLGVAGFPKFETIAKDENVHPFEYRPPHQHGNLNMAKDEVVHPFELW